MEILKELCAIHSPSGSEYAISQYLLNYIESNKSSWKVQPEIFHGEGFQDCIILSFGKPRTAVFAHIDSIGYTVGYDNNLIKIGGPSAKEGDLLVGKDSKGEICAPISIHKDEYEYLIYTAKFDRVIDPGTTLTYKQEFIENDEYVQSCYLDNRLGVWNALEIAKDLENGLIVFSCWEEHKGGSVGYLARFIYEKYHVTQALISDITWITNGVKHGEGVAISLRDSGIPRRTYLNKILDLAKDSGIPFQIEVESAGGSDGNALQSSPYPFDWCFIGAGESNVHSPRERVHKKDIIAMKEMYKYLMSNM